MAVKLQTTDAVEFYQPSVSICTLTLLHSKRPKLYTILAFLHAVGLDTLITLDHKVSGARKEAGMRNE